MPARYYYTRMSAEELSEALDRLDMTTTDLQFLAGAHRMTVEQWLSGDGDIPPWIPVLLGLLELPGAKELAFAVARERAKARNKE